MKVAAVQGSPRMDKGMTALILNPLLEGMKGTGAEVTLFYARKLKIRPCAADFDCWGSTPGECHIKDDMQALYPKFREAEVWVFGIPYYAVMPGEMQNLLNRLVPFLELVIRSEGGIMLPRRRKELQLKHIVLVSSCYFWEMEQFEELLGVMRKFSRAMGADLTAVLRPHAIVLRRKIDKGDDVSSVLDAAKAAGVEMVRQGSISDKTLRSIGEPLISREDYIKMHDEAGKS